MKIHWQYLKKPSVLIGIVVLFFVLLFLLNRSGGASAANTQTVSTGPSPAEIQAQSQMALAQLSAGLQQEAIQVDYAKSQDANATELGLAQIAAASQTQSLTVQQEIADRTVDAQTHGLDLQYQSLVNQNRTALAAAQDQYNYGLASQAITANTQLQMGAQQLQAMKMSTDANLVVALAGKNKYSSIALPAYFSAQNNGPSMSSLTVAPTSLH